MKRAALSFKGRVAALFFLFASVIAYAATTWVSGGYYTTSTNAYNACVAAYNASTATPGGDSPPYPKKEICATGSYGPSSSCLNNSNLSDQHWGLWTAAGTVTYTSYYYCANGSCPTGTVAINGKCEPACTAYPSGTYRSYSKAPTTGESIPSTLCDGNCTFESQEGIAFTTWWFAKFKSTGVTCVGGPGAGVTAKTNSPGANCVTSTTTGAEYCDSPSTNCGTVNGVTVCPNAIPPGTCTFVGGKGYICDDGDPGTTADDAPKPTDAAPNAAPDVFTWSTGNGSPSLTVTGESYYPSSTQGNSVGAQDSTLQGVKSSVDSLKSGQCGGTGQPACKIDEAGTPTAGTNDGDAAANAADSLMAGIGTSVGVAGSSAGWFSGLLPSYSSACEQLSIGSPGHTRLFPNTSECSKLTGFKEVLHWAFYVLTIIAVFFIGAKKTG